MRNHVHKSKHVLDLFAALPAGRYPTLLRSLVAARLVLFQTQAD